MYDMLCIITYISVCSFEHQLKCFNFIADIFSSVPINLFINLCTEYDYFILCFIMIANFVSFSYCKYAAQPTFVTGNDYFGSEYSVF